MTNWLKLTLQYLYRVRGSIFLHLASCFSIALIASLYHIPIQAIGYMILFISSMALLFLGIGCHQFRRRMQYLRVVWNGADVQLGTLPPAMTPWSSSTRIFSGGRQNAAPGPKPNRNLPCAALTPIIHAGPIR